MRSSRRSLSAVLALTATFTWSSRATSQQQAQGFALDRLYPSAPGGGWIVMDTLDRTEGIGGVVGLTAWYAHDPLIVRASDGAQRLAVVSDEALASFAFAVTYERWKLYLNLDMPLDVEGKSGSVGGYEFAAPNAGQAFTSTGVNPSTAPDALTDARVGVDIRLLGEARSAFRLGAGAQLLVSTPNTPGSEYLTDGALRAMGRLLFAGDIDRFSYAGQVGVHIRPRDDSPAPGGPQGSELLFGVAAGPKFLLGEKEQMALIAGPEVFGETAFRSFFGSSATGVEGLLSVRLEGTRDDGPQLRVKIGAGTGLDQRFGTPEWRMVFGVELFDHTRSAF